MYHPLYPIACRMVGRPVNAYHANGMVYHGILQSAAPQGIYLLNPNAAYVSTNKDQADSEASHAFGSEGASVELTYAPAAFFGFGALTGLTLGALATGYYW